MQNEKTLKMIFIVLFLVSFLPNFFCPRKKIQSWNGVGEMCRKKGEEKSVFQEGIRRGHMTLESAWDENKKKENWGNHIARHENLWQTSKVQLIFQKWQTGRQTDSVAKSSSYSISRSTFPSLYKFSLRSIELNLRSQEYDRMRCRRIFE